MSWQAIKWAINQKVGNPARKLLLLAIANYADEHGVCWPSQSRLARDTEASLDTVQRHTKKLVADGLLRVERPPKRRGQWQTFIYFLAMADKNTKPQNAAGQDDTRPRSTSPRHEDSASPRCEMGSGDQNAAWPDRKEVEAGPHDQAASGPTPSRTAMRSNPSKEQLIKQSNEPPPPTIMGASKPKFSAAERRQAWQRNGAVEVIQDRIARRLGDGNTQKGWLMLMNLSPDSLDFLTNLERRGTLDDETLQKAVVSSRLGPNVI